MEYINISHKRDHDCKIHAVSSEQHESYSVFNILKDAGVDMTTSEPFDKAIRAMNIVMDEIEAILDK